MEPAKIPHKPSFEDQLVCSSTSLDFSSYAAAAGSTHAWTPNNILCNGSSYESYPNSALLNSRNPRLQNDILVSSLNPSMTKDHGLEWTNPTNNFTHHDNNLPSIHNHHLQLNPQIKLETLDPYERLRDVITSPAISGIEDVQIPPACYNNYMKELRGIDDLSLKLLLRTLSCGGESSNGIQEKGNSLSSPAGNTSKRSLSCSQIYPTVNVNELLLNQQSSMGNSSGFGVDLGALDLFNSTRFGGSFRLPMVQGEVGFSKESCLPYAVDFMNQSIERPLECSPNMENLSNGVAESKRPEINSERKAVKTQVGTKRSRFESRACPPFKVRKEKLGDRVAALQQLVAPFGKTDTASVLMEAIGYIKFLHSQVETLSVPYLKSSRHKNNRAALHGGCVDNGKEERKSDLRSRGLCLVPLSCLSYVTDGGGGMWPPPSFG